MQPPPYQPQYDYQQQPKRKPPYIWWIIGGLCLCCACPLGIGATATRTPMESSPGGQKQATSKPIEDSQPYTVSNLKSLNEQGLRFVTGSLKNNTNDRWAYVQVQINLLDKSGAVVGSTMTNSNNIEGGQTWKFKALIAEESATSFELKDVTHW